MSKRKKKWPQPAGVPVPDLLAEAAKLYTEKNALYGFNYRHFGRIMSGLFPAGFSARSEAEWNRLGILLNLVTCLSRYCNFPEGHADSARDLTVYAAILQELTHGS